LTIYETFATALRESQALWFLGRRPAFCFSATEPTPAVRVSAHFEQVEKSSRADLPFARGYQYPLMIVPRNAVVLADVQSLPRPLVS
jgi:hypothetical protein